MNTMRLGSFDGHPKTRPTIITVIRMFRKERGLTYEEARDLAIDEFDRRGWEVPDSIRALKGRKLKI